MLTCVDAVPYFRFSWFFPHLIGQFVTGSFQQKKKKKKVVFFLCLLINRDYYCLGRNLLWDTTRWSGVEHDAIQKEDQSEHNWEKHLVCNGGRARKQKIWNFFVFSYREKQSISNYKQPAYSFPSQSFWRSAVLSGRRRRRRGTIWKQIKFD